ncbi:hypothetical protein PHMEG_00037165 [Phytophthora megakarya]|uniref:SWIM-type domain-containing protein n=1 Tax=Phytophthora megakarya TaxID=4795 RepID=A0A225ULM3_9STRA|nr:hypothetical protein PHMEG_00037165 [Phytophthora megakarya]
MGPDYKQNPFYQYFEEVNWETCKDEWVDYERNNLPHLSNHTNNRIENGWGKLKQRVDREYTIDELISTVVLLQEWSEDRYLTELKSIGTRQTQDVSDERDPELLTLMVHLSPHAYRLVSEQYKFAKAQDTSYKVEDSDPGQVVLTLIGNEESSLNVVKTETYTCSCAFMKTLLLPCRHVIYYRISIGAESGIPPPRFYSRRWSLLAPENDIACGKLEVTGSLRVVKKTC